MLQSITVIYEGERIYVEHEHEDGKKGTKKGTPRESVLIFFLGLGRKFWMKLIIYLKKKKNYEEADDFLKHICHVMIKKKNIKNILFQDIFKNYWNAENL